MYKKLLSNKFFRENPINEISAQNFVYISLEVEGFNKLAEAVVRRMTDRAEKQIKEIQEENDPDRLFKLLRGGCDTLCQEALRERVLEFEDVLVPRILAAYKRTLNDVFAENACRILVKCKKNHSKDILEMYQNIRSSYALSLISITLGFIGDEECIPILYEQFEEFKKSYKDENYEQGPLIGLLKLKDRFSI